MSEKSSSLIRDRIGCIDGWYRTEGGEMRSQLMDAADAVEAIESENAMLRQQLADVTESMGRVEERCAKLRELAVLNWEWAHSCCGNNCKMQTNDCGYQIDRECNYEREIWDRMRELGVVVE